MRRRQFLKIMGVSVGALWTGACAEDDAGPGAQPEVEVLPGLEFFPQGVASGDPGPGHVVLWTRVQIPDMLGDVLCRVEVAEDPGFERRRALGGRAWVEVNAEAFFDHCVKVRVEGLGPDEVFYYRFVVEVDGQLRSSRVGRSRTAPPLDSERPLRFAFVSCQDYNGKYYHAWRRLTALDPEFVLHLGDYVYETSGNPQFQDPESPRRIVFPEPEAAIVFHAGTDREYYAAKTLEQYRTLYRTYRSDVDLQEAHARFPFIVTWDDHEFSDDAWGAHGTYFDDRVDEEDVPRRKAANQAWFEYMPVDYPWEEGFRYDPEAPFPGDLRIYRDLRWGRLVHLVLPDVRTYRSDHVIPEGAYPGAVAVLAEELDDLGLDAPSASGPYLDVDAWEEGRYVALLRAAQQEAGGDPDQVRGWVSVEWLDQVLAAQPEAAVQAPTEAERSLMPRGVAYHHMGKRSPHTMLGVRNLVLEEPFRAYAKKRWVESGGASEDILGADQRAWFLQTMQGSTATWKVWANAFPLSDMVVDLRPIASLPPSLGQRFLMVAEDWAGSPHRRDELLTALADVDNVVVVTGDRHAFLAANPAPRGRPDASVVEVVTGAISSTSYGAIVLRYANSDPALRDAGAPVLASALRTFLLDRAQGANPHIADTLVREHGFVFVEADAASLTTTWYAVADSAASRAEMEEGEAAFRTQRFAARAGRRGLWRQTETGAWERWDTTQQAWLADPG